MSWSRSQKTGSIPGGVLFVNRFEPAECPFFFRSEPSGFIFLARDHVPKSFRTGDSFFRPRVVVIAYIFLAFHPRVKQVRRAKSKGGMATMRVGVGDVKVRYCKDVK